MNFKQFRKLYECDDMDNDIFGILKRNRIIIRISDDCWSWALPSLLEIYKNKSKDVRDLYERYRKKEIKYYEIDRDIIRNIFYKEEI